MDLQNGTDSQFFGGGLLHLGGSKPQSSGSVSSADTNQSKQALIEDASDQDGFDQSLIYFGPPIEFSLDKRDHVNNFFGIGWNISQPRNGNNTAVSRPRLSRTLSREDMKNGLQNIFTTEVQTGRLAFSTFIAPNLSLEDISLLNNFNHLIYIYMGNNKIPDMKPFTGMKKLLILDLTKNSIIGNQGDIPSIQTLEILSLSQNKIHDLTHFPKNNYIYLNLSQNMLKDLSMIDWSKFSKLEILELRGNKISSISVLDLPTLKHLWLAKNELTSIGFLKGCSNLVSFHARGNRINDLSGFPFGLKKLEYVNLRDNQIPLVSSMRFLGKSPIKTIVILGNPCHGLKQFRVEIVACVPTLVRLDKTIVTNCELEVGKCLRGARGKVAKGKPLQTPPPTPGGADCFLTCKNLMMDLDSVESTDETEEVAEYIDQEAAEDQTDAETEEEQVVKVHTVPNNVDETNVYKIEN